MYNSRFSFGVKLLFASIAFSTVMVACVKNDFDRNFIKLSAEAFKADKSATKASVNGIFTYWIDGESVWINNYQYTSTVNLSGEAVAMSVNKSPDHIYRSVYPSEDFVSRSGDNITINVPRDYYYAENGGLQVLENLPMVAYYDGSSNGSDPDSLKFKHITAAITVRVWNNKTDTIEIDRIELHNSQYQLAGNVTVDIKTAGQNSVPSITPNKTGNKDSVCVHFIGADKWEKTTIAVGSYKDFQIPILPVGSDNSSFTIKVKSHIRGASYNYNRSTPDRDNSIGRACLGYAVSKIDSGVQAEDLFEVIERGGKNWYEITCADELVTMSEAMDNKWNNVSDDSPYLAGNYIVTEDIDLDGRKFVPIHYYNESDGTVDPQRCTFDGQNHTIRDFIVSSENENEPYLCGVFGKTGGDSITIMNLNVEDGRYEFRHSEGDLPGSNNPCTAVGGIIAYIDHDGIIIENCNVSNITVEAQDDYNGSKQADMYVSGIVGYVAKPCIIRDCTIGTVVFNNTNETHPEKLIDQFGAAIGRLDVGYKHTYYQMKRGTTTDSNVVNPNVYIVTIENVTYDQGSQQMNFVAGLKNIRYGGLIANITEGGIVVIKNCKITHNCIVHQPATANNMYLGGFIGWIRSSHVCGIELHADGCSISGTIENATNSKNYVNRYIGASSKAPVSLGDNSCTNTLTVTGTTPGFLKTGQVLNNLNKM